MASSNPPTGSVESLAARAVVSLPTAWRVVTVIGSIASTVVMVCGGIAFNLVRTEWTELRSEVRLMRAKIDAAPTAEDLGKLSEDVRDLERRVIRVEVEVRR